MERPLAGYDALTRAGVTPQRATIELIEACNLRCVHCYLSGPRRRPLTYREVVGLLDHLAAAGTLFLTLTGGEVALRADLCRIIKAARRRHFFLTVLTSGTLWTDQDWDRLADAGLDRVRLSVYATTPAIHDRITGVSGSFERTMATASALHERGVAVQLAFTAMRANHTEAGGLARYCRDHGLGFVFDTIVTGTEADRTSPERLQCTADELTALYRDPMIAEAIAVDRFSRRGDAVRPCGVGDAIFVRCDGDVFPCSYWPHAAGNVREKSIVAIFRDSVLFKQCRSLRRTDLDRCSRCALDRWCRTCPALNLAENQAMDVPSATSCADAAAFSRARETPPV